MQVCPIEDVVFVLQEIRTKKLHTKNGVVLSSSDYVTMSRLRLIEEVLHHTALDIKPIRKAVLYETD